MVAGRDDIANGDVPQCEVHGGSVKRAAVVDVQAVVDLIAKHEVRDRHVRRITKLDPIASAINDCRIRWVGAANRHLLQISAIMPATIHARLQNDLIAGGGRSQCRRKLGGRRDDTLQANDFARD